MKLKELDSSYNEEQAFLIFKEFGGGCYYLVDLNTNTIRSKHSDLFALKEYLEQRYDIVNTVKADKLCLSWED